MRLTRRMTVWGLVAAAAAEVLGCSLPQSTGHASQARFLLESLGTPAETPVEVGRRPVPVGGVLTVDLKAFLRGLRRVLQVSSDVHRVEVTVRAADGTVHTQVLDRLSLDAGQTIVTFTGLVDGPADIEVVALDVNSQVIRQANQSTTVTLGTPTDVDVSAVVSSSGGSGGSAPIATATTPPGLTAHVAIADGQPIDDVSAGTIVLAMAMPADVTEASAFLPDATSGVWAVHSNGLTHLSPNGQVLNTVATRAEASLAPLADNGWAFANDNQGFRLVRLGADGSELLSMNLWRLARWNASQRALATADNGDAWVGLSAHPDEPAVLQDQTVVTQQQLLRVRPDGVVAARIQLDWNVEYLCTDRDQNLLMIVRTSVPGPASELWPWTGRSHLVKLAPDGTVLAEYGLVVEPWTVGVDQEGYAWVSTHGYPRRILKLKP